MPATEYPITASIPIDQIIADHERVQPRTKLDEDAVVDYLANVGELPPIDVYRVVDRFYVTNGFHRHYVLVKAGKDMIPVRIVGEGTIEDAILEATSNASNRKNGLRLTRADKRRSVRLTILCPKAEGWTDAEIAEHCGVSRPLVAEVRAELGGEGLVDPEAERFRRDGKPVKPRTSPGRSIVDGVEQDDPPDIAEDRAAGRIPEGVVPVVSAASTPTEWESDPEPEEADDDELSKINAMPLASVLEGAPLMSFRREAAFYLRFNEARRAATAAFAGIKAAIAKDYGGANATPYEDRVVSSLRVNGPENWEICPPEDKGGCGGTGKDGIGVRCMKCRGVGYLIG